MAKDFIPDHEFTPDEEAQQEVSAPTQRTIEGAPETIETAARSALSGMTMGVSEPAISGINAVVGNLIDAGYDADSIRDFLSRAVDPAKLHAEYQRDITRRRQLEQEHPEAATAGELAGGVIGALGTGGAQGLATKALTAPMRAVETAAGLASKAVPTQLGKAIAGGAAAGAAGEAIKQAAQVPTGVMEPGEGSIPGAAVLGAGLGAGFHVAAPYVVKGVEALAKSPFGKSMAKVMRDETGAIGRRRDQTARRLGVSENVAKKVLNEDNFSILTAENPRAQKLTPEENAALMKQLVDELENAGIPYLEVQGNYGGTPENSILIPHHGKISKEVVERLARKYNQESVVHKLGKTNELHYVSGKNTGKKIIGTGKAQGWHLNENYTEVPGVGRFSLNLDFDNLKPGKLLHYSKAEKLQGEKIEPEFYGGGAKGEELKRVGLIPRTYYYEAHAVPEDVVLSGAKSVHEIERPENIIDLASPEAQKYIQKGFAKNQAPDEAMNEIEMLLRNDGYAGYKNSAGPLPDAVALFHAHQPLKSEPMTPAHFQNINIKRKERAQPLSAFAPSSSFEQDAAIPKNFDPEKHEKVPQIIELQEGANKGRKVRVLIETSDEFDVKALPGEPPLLYHDDKGFLTRASQNGSVVWDKSRAHKVIEFGIKEKASIPEKEIIPKIKRVFKSEDVDAVIPHSKAQKELIDGIELHVVTRHEEDRGGWTDDWAISGVAKNRKGKSVIVKGRMPDNVIEMENYGDALKDFTTAQREGAYYNLAKYFGLQDYVPTTSVINDVNPGADWVQLDHGAAGNHYSVMEKIPSATHWCSTTSQRATIKKLLENGELYKLAIMNTLLGNTDRHPGNFMFSPKGFHLIDHGFTFDYYNPERRTDIPSYLQIARGFTSKIMTIHPKTLKWLNNLDVTKLKSFLKTHKIPVQFTKPIIEGLKQAKKIVAKDPDIDIESLLRGIASEMRKSLKGYEND